MFSRLREHFGTAGLVVAIVALVAALGGGAYAATGGQGGGKATASAKQGKQGKPGKTGKTGKTGPAGPAGPSGPAGPAGAPGPKGDKGDAGPQGKEGPQGPQGIQGKAGKEGQSGFTKELPGEETETGVWSFGEVAAVPVGFSPLRIPLSFNIPLAAGLGASNVHFINQAGKEVKDFGATEVENPPKCTGSAAEPTAAPGHLCVYTSNLIEAKGSSDLIGNPGEEAAPGGTSTAGAVLTLFGVKAEASGWGTWAVTAEEG
jgi:Collagen triple helix repeat (20 copies)